MTYFLLEFDRRENHPVWTTFEDVRMALAALREKEAGRLDHVEVVLLMSSSLDDLRKTHSRYFPGELVRQLEAKDWINQLSNESVRRAIAAQAS